MSRVDSLCSEAESLRSQVDSLLAQAARTNSIDQTMRLPETNRVQFGGWHWIRLDYPPSYDPRPRWGHDRPGHDLLTKILQSKQDQLVALMCRMLDYSDELAEIPVFPNPSDPNGPSWFNGWIPALDTASLYVLLADNKPRRYMEIGSGSSTKFVRRAMDLHSPETRLISVDPHPRAEINKLCTEVVRMPLEAVPVDYFDILGENDILFYDGSHRAFMNSDVTAFFIDILPRLNPGVTVGIHDIFIPYDYSVEFGKERWYSEQYLLMTYLLGGGNNVEVLLPNAYISHNPELKSVLAPLWDKMQPHWESPESPGLQPFGGLFWMRTK